MQGTQQGDILATLQWKKPAATHVSSRRHAQVGAVDVTVAILFAIPFQVVMPHRLPVVLPVLNTHAATDGVGAQLQLRAEPVRRDNRIRIGKRQPAHAERQRVRCTRRARHTDIARCDAQG